MGLHVGDPVHLSFDIPYYAVYLRMRIVNLVLSDFNL